jgi:hypothetical protein
MTEQKIDAYKVKAWAAAASFIYEKEQKRAGQKEFRIKRGGFKVLLNGKPLYDGSDVDKAVEIYNSAFENKIKLKEKKS